MAENADIPGMSTAARLARLPVRYIGRSPMRIAPARPIVTFTFDDFPRSAALAGRAALERRGWRGTYFASGCFVDQETFYGPMVSADDLRDLERNGHEIGCHTFTHVNVCTRTPQDLAAEVEGNAAILARLGLRERPSVFAYPYGEASVASKRMLAERFAACRSVRQGINRGRADRGFLKAVPIDGGEPGITRALAYADDLARRGGWLIYYTHDIADRPSQWGCTREQFERVLTAVEATGAEVLPMRRALERMAARAAAPDGPQAASSQRRIADRTRRSRVFSSQATRIAWPFQVSAVKDS